MSNRRDNDPSLDYFELRRRHEEYKNRERLAKLEKKGIDRTEPPRTRPQANTSVQPAASEVSESSVDPNESVELGHAAMNAADGEDNSVELEAPIEQAAPVESDTSAEPEAFEEDDYNIAAADDGYESEDRTESSEAGYEDGYEDESFADENPNPFDSFIRVFHGLKNRLSQRRGRRNAAEEAPDAYDEEYFEDESSVEGEALAEDYADDSAGEVVENAPAHRGFFARRHASKAQFEEPSEEIEDVPMDETLDIEDEPPAGEALDIEDDLPIPQTKSIDGNRQREDPEIDEDYEDEDYSEDEADESVSDNLSRFQKFLRLFIVPIDPDEDAGDDYDTEDDEDERTAIHMNVESSEDLWDDDNVYVNTDETRHNPHAVADEIEGGLEMADQNKVNPELTNQLAADLERPGLSRRERRELAERLAAERAAAEQANIKAQKSADAAEIPDLFAEQPLEADSIENVSSGIVDIKPTQQNDVISSVDEPTREFKPVSKLNFDEFMNAVETSQKSDLLNDEDGDDEDEEDEDEKPARRSIFSRRNRKEDDEDEDEEDDEDEEEEVKPRKRLFGRKAARYDEDEDDEDDYDDEDEEEEEDIKPKSRRNKKSRRDRYDDEDDEYDEYDDYDDDEDDYDDYDDEDDDYDDDDEDDVGIGYRLLSVLKALVVIFLILVVLFFVVNILNLVNVVSLDSIAAKMPSGVVNVLLPSQNFKSSDNADNDIDFSTPDSATNDQNMQGADLTPTESATEVPPTSSPDLDLTGGNTGDGQTSTITNAPSDNVGAANSVG